LHPFGATRARSPSAAATPASVHHLLMHPPVHMTTAASLATQRPAVP
jgi:hypothetical protein